MMAEKNNVREHAVCPYCDAELAEEDSPLCQACRVELPRCASCGKVLAADQKICPNCGAGVKG